MEEEFKGVPGLNFFEINDFGNLRKNFEGDLNRFGGAA